MWVGLCTPVTFTNADANCKGISGIITQFSSNYAKNQNIYWYVKRNASSQERWRNIKKESQKRNRPIYIQTHLLRGALEILFDLSFHIILQYSLIYPHIRLSNLFYISLKKIIVFSYAWFYKFQLISNAHKSNTSIVYLLYININVNGIIQEFLFNFAPTFLDNHTKSGRGGLFRQHLKMCS